MPSRLTLPPRLDVDAASDLWGQLREAQGSVTLDASGLQHVSAAGLQVLLVTATMLERAGSTFCLAGLPATCRARLAEMGALDRFILDPIPQGGDPS